MDRTVFFRCIKFTRNIGTIVKHQPIFLLATFRIIKLSLRAVFVDLEPTVVDEIPCRKCYVIYLFYV